MTERSRLGYFGSESPFKQNNNFATSGFNQSGFNNYWGGQDASSLQLANRQQFSGLNTVDRNSFLESNFEDSGLNQDFDMGLNLGTLQLGTAAFNAYNGVQANKAAERRNDIAEAELGQNAKSFDVNAGMQLATLQNEETRRNAYAGGFLDNSQRSDRFKDYDLQKLSVAGA